MKKQLLFAYSILCTAISFAQIPSLTKDINKVYYNSNAAKYYAAGNVMYFAANGNNNAGSELWKSDGTPAGTVMVKDIYVGTTSSNPENFCLVGSTVFFTAVKDGFANRELWKTDGTAAGTVLVKDIYPGTSGSEPENLLNYKGILLFTATNGVAGGELWRSDGTDAGTYMVKDILAGANSSFSQFFTIFGDSVYFRCSSISGTELWCTDGTQAGTQLFKDIYPGNQSSNPSNFVLFKNKLFFIAQDSATGQSRLWSSDGTPSGTLLYKNQTTKIASNYLTEHKGRLYYSGYYSGDQELLYTDGINDIQYFNIDQFGSSTPADLRSVGNKLFFTASVDNGRELYVSDGTSAGTYMTRDLCPIQTDGAIGNMVVNDSTLYFTAQEIYGDIELYSASGKVGKSASPSRVKDILKGQMSSRPSYLTPFNNKVYFTANDEIFGNEVWVVDSGKATLFKDVAAGTQGSGIASTAVLNGKIIFNATTPEFGDELWTSRGDTGSTQLIKNIDYNTDNSTPRDLYTCGSKTLFTAITHTSSSTSYGTFQSTDGTNSGTNSVKNIPGVNAQPREHVLYNNKVYFVADQYSYSPGMLCFYDTASKSITTASNLNPSGLGDKVRDLTVYKNKLFFSAYDGNTNGEELFYIDGASGNISLFADIRSGSTGSFVKSLEVGDSILFFCANDGVKGVELWATDGTVANTKLVKDVYLGSTGSAIDNITAYNHKVYFSATTAFEGNELWRSDGTDTGTVMVADINSGSGSSNPRNFTVVNNLLYFTATTAANGEELWVSDGTTAGTRMIKDITPGATGSNIRQMKGVRDNLYFSANDGINGQELWKTDGSTSGTNMQFELIPGSESSNPDLLTPVGDTLYFSADHPDYGNELWYVFTNCIRGSFSGKSTCVSDTISFTDLSDSFGKTKAQFSWDFGNGDTSNIQHPKYAYDSAGTYTVSLTVTNNEGCSSKNTQTFTIDAFPIANFSLETDSLCKKGNLFKFTNLSSPVSGPFLWTFGDNGTTANTSPTHIYNNAGPYTVTLSVGSTPKCKASLSRTVFVRQSPVIASINGPLTSRNDSIDTYEVDLHTGSTYSWVITGGVVIAGAGTNNINVKWDNSGVNGTVKVIETNNVGCESDPKTINVKLSNGVGLYESTLDPQLLVYPSPTTGVVIMKSLKTLDEITVVEVYDLLGKVVYSNQWNTSQNNTLSIDLSGNAEGIYLIQITNSGGSSQRKIVLTR